MWSQTSPTAVRVWFERMDGDPLQAATNTLEDVSAAVPGLAVSVYGTGEYREYTDKAKLLLWDTNEHRPLQEMIYSKARTDARAGRVQAALADLKSYVQGFKERSPGCVDYGDVLVKMTDERLPVNLIVASGNPCDTLKLKLRSGSQPRILVLLMLEQNVHTPDYKLFAQRERVFKRIMPSAVVLKPYETDKLRRLLLGGKIDPTESEVVTVGSLTQEPASITKITAAASGWNCNTQVASQMQSGLQLRLSIVAPNAGARVGWQSQVEGKGACDRSVWFVIHPDGDSTYYVQQRAEVRAHGSFVGTVILGRGGDDVDCGAVFEIRAFESPRGNLFLGKKLSSWPEAEAASISIPVRRECGRGGL